MATVTERNITVRMPTNDIFQTSTGVGHHWRPGFYFPDSTFKFKYHDPLPPVLARPPEIVPEDHFKTTNQVNHDNKYPFELRHEPTFKKAPASNKVHYLKDFMENIPNKGWRRPLSPSHQKTETQDEFCNRPALVNEPERWVNFQPFNLRDHFTEGPSKRIIATTENPKLKGRNLYPKDQEVLRNLDPYLTTYDKHYRIYDPKEWNGIGKKDIPTYWDCEEYPKSKGFGPKVNNLSKSAVPREQPPMRDTVKFKAPTFIRRYPTNGDHVPHKGLLTEYNDHYIKPSDVKSAQAHICPIDYPSVIPDPNPTTKYDVPHMYETEYQNIGCEYPAVLQ